MSFHVFNRSFVRQHDYDLVDSIDVTASPVSKLKYEQDAVIDQYSPLKCTPQDQLVALIDDTTPVKAPVSRYDENPVIELVSPLKSDPSVAEIIQANDSRHFQSKKERVRNASRKFLFKGKRTRARIMLTSLYQFLRKSKSERSHLFRREDEQSDSGKHVDVVIRKRTCDVFGKCVIDGQISGVTGFSEEQTFEMEDQRIRLMLDQELALTFAARLDSGRTVRVYYPFTLILDQHADYVLHDFFFLKSLPGTESPVVRPKILFEWDCPCRPTDQRVTPAVQPEHCFPPYEPPPPYF